MRKVFAQGVAPLPSLAICTDSQSVFAGCWDKNIYQIRLWDRRLVRTLQGHTDFVKCLLSTTLNGKSILVSGGADATIIIWDVEFSKPLHKLKGHTKSLQALAIDPRSVYEGTGIDAGFVLFSASSDREIRRWHISYCGAREFSDSIAKPILAHDTSVYSLCFDSEGDLWTASADKTAKHLVRTRDWEADTVLPHPDFVRDVVVAERLGVVVTACRDEDVRVWDIASGDLVCAFSGHFEEVTALVLLGKGSRVASASIDGTIRSWGLTGQEIASYQEELKREADGLDGEEGDVPAKQGVLTAEEEAELAELMDDDD